MRLKRKTIVIRRNLIFASFAFALMLFFGNASSVFACMCGKSSVCEQYNFYRTIFVGTAVRIEKGQKASFKTETTVFEVAEMFSGENAEAIRVQNKSGFSCGVEFNVGETYLIFAGGNKQEGFVSGYCSGNLPIEYARDVIPEMRNISKATGDGQLKGTVLEESTKRTQNEERAPIKDVRLNITNVSTGRKYVTKTNTNGRYEVSVTPGKYSVEPVAPSNSVLTSLFDVKPMEVRSGGCAEGFFVLANDSILAGQLVDENGRPASFVRVELVSVDEPRSYLGGKSGESDSKGYFSFKQIPAGKYTISVNYNSNPDPERPFPTTFYPNGGDRSGAKVFDIGFGEKIEGISWRLPDKLIETTILGNVTWQDGSPAVGAEIKLFDLAFPGFYAGCSLLEQRDKPETVDSPVRATSFRMTGSACDLRSDSNGNFQLSGYTGRTYRLSASLLKTNDSQKMEFSGKSEAFSVLGGPSIIKLVLTKNQ